MPCAYYIAITLSKFEVASRVRSITGHRRKNIALRGNYTIVTSLGLFSGCIACLNYRALFRVTWMEAKRGGDAKLYVA